MIFIGGVVSFLGGVVGPPAEMPVANKAREENHLDSSYHLCSLFDSPMTIVATRKKSADNFMAKKYQVV